jgi:pyruvate/2-oxoglutarate dehydrogenase complex dihydrolipoamide acyltransferase (E2) component
MQPEVVARTLATVEDEWKSQAAKFVECNATQVEDCSASPNAFSRSCSVVVSAVVQASSGNLANVKEYMGTVCGEPELTGWHQERCTELASAVTDNMIYDDYGNRENFNSNGLCTNFWSKFVVEEKARMDQERAEREAAEKKAAEEAAEAAKKAAEEAAQLKMKQDREEAEKKAEEAKRKAEEAAADLAAKKAEAERQAEEAKAKMEEAKSAAEAAAKHHKALLNGTNATAAAPVQNKTVVAAPSTPSPVVANSTVPAKANATK